MKASGTAEQQQVLSDDLSTTYLQSVEWVAGQDTNHPGNEPGSKAEEAFFVAGQAGGHAQGVVLLIGFGVLI